MEYEGIYTSYFSDIERGVITWRESSIVDINNHRCNAIGAYDIFKGNQETVSFNVMYLSLVNPISSACKGGL